VNFIFRYSIFSAVLEISACMAMLESLVLDLLDVETLVLDSNVALDATEKILGAPPGFY